MGQWLQIQDCPRSSGTVGTYMFLLSKTFMKLSSQLSHLMNRNCKELLRYLPGYKYLWHRWTLVAEGRYIWISVTCCAQLVLSIVWPKCVMHKNYFNLVASFCNTMAYSCQARDKTLESNFLLPHSVWDKWIKHNDTRGGKLSAKTSFQVGMDL